MKPISTDFQRGTDGHRDYTISWLVRSDDRLDGPLEVTAPGGSWPTSGLPTLYVDTYKWGNSEDTAAVFVDGGAKYVREQDDYFVWQVTGKFTSRPIDQLNSGTDSGSGFGTPESPADNSASTAPPDRPFQFKVSVRQEETALAKDRTSPTPKDVVNSAGQPFATPHMVPQSVLVLSLEMYTADSLSTTWTKALTYLNSASSTSFMGCNPGTLRCTYYTFETAYEQGQYFVKKNLTIEYKSQGWYLDVVDAGTMCTQGTGQPLRPALDSSGQPATGPVPFDGSGLELGAGGSLVYLQFQPYPIISWASII